MCYAISPMTYNIESIEALLLPNVVNCSCCDLSSRLIIMWLTISTCGILRTLLQLMSSSFLILVNNLGKYHAVMPLVYCNYNVIVTILDRRSNVLLNFMLIRRYITSKLTQSCHTTLYFRLIFVARTNSYHI